MSFEMMNINNFMRNIWISIGIFLVTCISLSIYAVIILYPFFDPEYRFSLILINLGVIAVSSVASIGLTFDKKTSVHKKIRVKGKYINKVRIVPMSESNIKKSSKYAMFLLLISIPLVSSDIYFLINLVGS